MVFFFKNRGCSWLPSNRVRNSVLERVLVLPEEQKASLAAKGIDDADILNIIENGDVDFSESLKHSEPKVYLFEGPTDVGKEVKLYITLPAESFVSEVHFKEASIKQVRNTVSGKGGFISFPKDEELLYVDSTEVLQRQKKEFGIHNSKLLLRWLKSSGKMDFSRTNFRVKPKTEHVLLFNDEKGRELALKALWYKEKINVISISFADTL